MKISKSKILVVGMSFVTAIAFFASTAGTLAWYAFSTRVSMSYIGTSVRKSELIHIGLIDGEENPNTHKFTPADEERYQLTRELVNGESIVWTSSSTGFPVEVTRTYLERTNYASNSLSPVTSKSRTADGALSLFRSPGYGEITVSEAAKTSQYVYLPFVFKSIGSDDKPMKDTKIWLTNAEVQATGERINEAVRMHVDNGVDQFLVNPNSSVNTTGSTKMGGMLDLDGDGTYDFAYDELSSSYKECAYGEIDTGTPTYGAPYDKDYDVAPLVDANGVTAEGFTGASTFYAKHKKDVKPADLTNVEFKTADYYTFKGLKPGVDGNGNYVGTMPICTTDHTYGIAHCLLTIYLEGWDHAVINAAIGYEFNLGLTFEIDKV